MKYCTKLCCWFTAVLLLSACGSSPSGTDSSPSATDSSPSKTKDGEGSADAGTNPTTSFELTVTNGFGSGSYESGSTVHVWSDHDPRTQVVANWSGDSVLLTDTGEWHTSFVMPSRNVTLNAELESTSFQLVEEQFEGRDRSKTVRYMIPSNPLGVVHFTHGTGGSGAFIEGIEAGTVARVLVQAGYGVLGDRRRRSGYR